MAGVMTLGSASPADAAITSPFTQVFSANTTGSIQLRGNTVMTCQTAATSCAGARVGTNIGANLNDNNFGMVYADVDSDATTFNSSSSTVNIPDGASILFAALTWGGDTSAGGTINNAQYGTTPPAAAITAANAGQVSLKVPGSSTYQTVASTRTTFISGTAGAYQGYANVTSTLQAAGNGSYTVANVQAGTGSDRYAGWGLTIAYSNPTDPPRNLAVFSGFGTVTGGNVVDIPVSGFVTPPSGAVRTTLGAISYEGDAGSTGDQMQLGNTTSTLSNVTDALHPVANTFTSVISELGVDSSTRAPSYKNQMGYDEATFNVNGFLGNNASSGDIRLTSASGGETYYPGVVTFATDLYSPNLSATKSVALVHKAAGNTVAGTPEPGDTLRYTIATTNGGADDSVNTVLTDVVPTDTTYVPGSLTAGGTTLTDAPTDDVGRYTSGTRTVQVNLGTGATATAGGTVVSGGDAATVTFDVTIDNTISDGEEIDNTAKIAYSGSQTGINVTGASNAVVAAAVRKHSELSITKTASVARVQKGSATQVTYTLTATNSGPYDDPAVTVSDALAAGTAVVSATPSAGTCTTPAGSISCAVGAVPVGGTATLTVVATLDGTTDPATDTASVAGTNLDSDASNDSASVSTVVNSAPVAHNDTATAVGGTAQIAVLNNDTDPDGDPLSVSIATGPAHGTVVVNGNNTVTYTANAGATGSDTFTYQISDGRGGTSTATVTVGVPNAPPVAIDDAYNAAPGQALTLSVLDNDTDPNIPGSGQALSVGGVTQPAGGKGSVTTDGTTIVFIPSSTFLKGSATFDYTVSDGAGGTDTGTVTVTIPNVAPVAVNDSATTAYSTPNTVDVLANDTDANGDVLTVTAVTAGAHGTAVITGTGANTTVTYTPDAGWSGTDVVTYTVSDGTTTRTATLTVTTGNGSPIANDFGVTVDGGAASAISLLPHASDPNGDSLTVPNVGTAAHGTVTVSPTTGIATYTPDPTFAGTDTFTYTVDDGNGGTSTGTVTVTIGNQDPNAGDDSATTPRNGQSIISVLDNDTDPNGDPLAISAVGAAHHGTATANPDGTITYVPDTGFSGVDTFDYTVSDGNGGTSTALVTVNVVNSAPVATLDTAIATGAAGSPLTIDVLANDTDANGDDLSISAVTQPAHGTTAVVNGQVVYTPDASYHGTDTFSYTVSDGHGGTDTATVTVTVQNRAPVAVDDSASVATGVSTAIDVLANDSDPDGEALTITSYDAASAHGGTVTVDDAGVVNYTSATGFTGTDTFSYTVTDPRGATSTAVVTVTVANADPISPNLTATTGAGAPVTVDLLNGASDPDNQPVSISGVGPAAHGTVALDASGHATYTPDAGFTGTDTFTYTVSDGQGGTSTGTVTVTVLAGAPPVLVPDTGGAASGDTVTFDPLDNDHASTGATLIPSTLCLVNPAMSTCSSTVTVAEVGTWTVHLDGTVTFVPAAGFSGAATITYRVTDTNGEVASSTLTARIAAAPSTNPGGSGSGSNSGSGSGSNLAFTGVEAGGLGITGLAAVLLGLGLLLAARRRRSGGHQAE
jgi:uncharacterized repeat protein (TIGR01451 family)